MKTKVKPTFPAVRDKEFENILSQLVQQYAVIEMFYSQEHSPAPSQLIIHVEQIPNAPKLRQSRWIQKLRRQKQIDVHFMDSKSLEYRLSLGYPYVELYCHPSLLIYRNKLTNDLNPVVSSWEQYKQLFRVHLDQYMQDRDFQKAQIKNLIEEGSSLSVFNSYQRLIENDIAYLEELYMGKKVEDISLPQRISHLITYNPGLQKCFVKSGSSKYFITDIFDQVKKASQQYDEVFREELHDALAVAEQALFYLIVERFSELNHKIKNRFEQQIKDSYACAQEAVVNVAIEVIIKRIEAEQIFLFHKELSNGKHTYFLLLIAQGASNEKLKITSESLNQIDKDHYCFVLIGHSRNWIQKYLYEYQSFFEKNTQKNMLIYASSPYHPDFHWLVPYENSHEGLSRLYSCTQQSALQFETIAGNTNENYSCIDTLFALFFLSFCRNYIYIKTYYLPNYLCSKTLWQLCVYADPAIRKFEYLFDQFWTDFFVYVDKHRNIVHDTVDLKKDRIAQMSIIVENLSNELNTLRLDKAIISEGDRL